MDRQGNGVPRFVDVRPVTTPDGKRGAAIYFQEPHGIP